MCDYCDCRSHREIADLSADHEHLLGQLRELSLAVAAGDRTEAARLMDHLHGVLHDHAHREELGVFGQLRGHAGSQYIELFESDHRALHELVADVSSGDWALRATGLVDSLSAHIAREESDLFPAAHQMLSPADWDVVDATRAGALQ